MTDGAGRRTGRDMQSAIDEVEQQFALLFSRVRGDMRDRAVRLHPELTLLGYSVLAVLARSESMRPGEIARELNLDKSTMSRQTAELERLGLVEREPDPADHRSIRLTLTPDAAARILAERGRQRSATYEQLSAWPLEDLRELGSLLGRLNELTSRRA
jgi:DNA-binding MarR family transcriptional regulator